MLEINYQDIDYVITLSDFSFFVFKKDISDYTEPNILFNGKFKESGIYDLSIQRIDYANKDFILLVEEKLKEYYSSVIEEAKEREAVWNRKEEKDNKRIKDDLNSGVGKIISKFKKIKGSITLNDITNIFFDTLVDNITDADLKQELAFLRNRVNILVDKINNQIK